MDTLMIVGSAAAVGGLVWWMWDDGVLPAQSGSPPPGKGLEEFGEKLKPIGDVFKPIGDAFAELFKAPKINLETATRPPLATFPTPAPPSTPPVVKPPAPPPKPTFETVVGSIFNTLKIGL